MKRFVAICIIALVVGGGSLAGAWTYEGELNPNLFSEWPEITGSRKMIAFGLVQTILKNPDETAEIKRVRIFVNIFADTVIGYDYFKGGQAFSFTLDMEQNRYVRNQDSHRDLHGCMECHADQLTHKERI